MFKGSITALITPFTENNAVDEKAFQAFVEWQIAEGSHGLVPVGTTGESATLSHEEHNRVIDLCLEVAKGKVPVIAGTGSNSTDEAIATTRYAKKAGADAALIVTPYYNKPSQEGLYQHFKAINDVVDLPVILYVVPGRCGVDMTTETIARLSRLPNIIGIKDATGDLNRPVRTRLAAGSDFCQLSGDDGTTLSFLAHGGHGSISVTANIAPRLCAELHNAWQAGNVTRALELQDLLMPVHDVMFCESNPMPVKYASTLLGKSNGRLRLPLVEIAQSNQPKVEAALRAAGILA